MPLIGVIDPSHREQSRARAGKLPKWLTIDELHEKSAAGSSKYSDWPYELVAAAIQQNTRDYHVTEQGTRVSVSGLTSGCPRGYVLQKKEDYVASLSGMYLAMRGTYVHAILEANQRPGAIAEARFYTEVDGITVVGSPDLVTETTVYDYKTTENPPTFGYPYRHHTEQVMYYAFILRHFTDFVADGDLPFDPRDTPVVNAVVVYLGPKTPKPILVEHKEKWVTPAGLEKEGKRPFIWSDKEVLDGHNGDTGLRVRLHALVKAMESYPKWPAGVEEVWGGQPGWKCPGPPLCYLPDCLAKREPEMYVWENPA